MTDDLKKEALQEVWNTKGDDWVVEPMDTAQRLLEKYIDRATLAERKRLREVILCRPGLHHELDEDLIDRNKLLSAIEKGDA
jgi:hypothetical protein